MKENSSLEKGIKKGKKVGGVSKFSGGSKRRWTMDDGRWWVCES